MAQGIKPQGVTPADVAAAVIRDADESLSAARMDVQELHTMAARAMSLLDQGRLLHAMSVADAIGNLARSVARRLEVTQATKNIARKVAAPEKW